MTSAALGQDADSTLFVDRVDVNVVNVEVWVTDSEGRRVRGLEKDDFELLENGVPVEITNFFAVDRQERMELSLERTQLPESPQPPGELRLLPVDRQLNLVVYVDNYNLSAVNRNRALDDLRGFLEDRVRMGDNVMLIEAFRGAEVVQPFTRDWTQIGQVLSSMRRSATHRQLDEAEILQRIRSMSLAVGQGSPRRAHDFVRGYVETASIEVRRTAAALRDTVRSLSGLPGRKALLYVSEGVPQRPGEELYQQLQVMFNEFELTQTGGPSQVIDPSLEALLEDQSDVLNDIVREANANQVTLYTLDAGGPGGLSGLSAATAGTAIAGSGGRIAFANIRKQNLQQPLIEMAEGTGGASILESFNFDMLVDRLAEDFDSFYSLGYSPTEVGESEYRDIEVRVKAEGLEVRHRTGFLLKSREERVADRTLSSLFADLEKNPLGVEIDFGDWQRSGRKKAELPILIRVPIDKVTLLPGSDGHKGRLRFYVAVKDEEGAISDVHEQVYPVVVPADQLASALGREVGYMVTLEVRSGLVKVAVGVWDELSDENSFVHKEARVGGRKGA